MNPFTINCLFLDLDAVLANFSNKGVTEAKIESFMGTVLKRAPDQKGGLGRPDKNVHFERETQEEVGEDETSDNEDEMREE